MGGEKGVIRAVTDSEMAVGFRLAGIETLPVTGVMDGARTLESLLERHEPGVVIFNQAYLAEMSERNRKKAEGSTKPVFVGIPTVESFREGGGGEEYFSRLLRTVIGYQIKLRRK